MSIHECCVCSAGVAETWEPDPISGVGAERIKGRSGVERVDAELCGAGAVRVDQQWDLALLEDCRVERDSTEPWASLLINDFCSIESRVECIGDTRSGSSSAAAARKVVAENERLANARATHRVVPILVRSPVCSEGAPAPELVNAVLRFLECLDPEGVGVSIVSAITMENIVGEELEIKRDGALRHLTLESASVTDCHAERWEQHADEHADDRDRHE